MISKEKKFIFIHNFKTGGTSIEKKLGHFDTLQRDVQDHRTIKDIELLTNRSFFLKKSAYALKIGKPKSALKNLKIRSFRNLLRLNMTLSTSSLLYVIHGQECIHGMLM